MLDSVEGQLNMYHITIGVHLDFLLQFLYGPAFHVTCITGIYCVVLIILITLGFQVLDKMGVAMLNVHIELYIYKKKEEPK